MDKKASKVRKYHHRFCIEGCTAFRDVAKKRRKHQQIQKCYIALKWKYCYQKQFCIVCAYLFALCLQHCRSAVI